MMRVLYRMSFLRSAPLRGVLCLFLCLFLPLSATFADEDFQIWLDQTLGHDLDEFRTLRADQSFRFGDDVSQLNTYTVLFGLQVHKLSWIEQGFYLRLQQDRFEESSQNEFRPTYDLTFKWGEWGGLRWIDRSRFEYRVRESQSDRFRYRNRLKLVLPAELSPLNLKPYGGVEVFSEVGDSSVLNVTRLRGLMGIQTEADGFIRRLTLKDGRRLTLDLYLMVQRVDEDSFSENDYIIGTKAGYFF